MTGMGIYEVADFGVMSAQNAAVSAINETLSSLGAATHAAASVVTPAGGDPASVRAVAQQQAAITHYSSMFQLGMEQLRERAIGTEMFNGVAQATESAGAAGFAL